MKMFRTIKCGMLAAFLLLGIAAPLTFTSCENEHPEINVSLKSDYSGIISAINSVDKSLADKLAQIESAVKDGTLKNAQALEAIKAALSSMEGTVAEKLAAIENAVKDQTTSFETKMALIETALNEGFAGVEEGQDLMKQALESLEGTMEEKLAAIKDAVDDQTLSLETKLDLINTAVTEGFASLAEGQEMIVEALNAIDGTIDEKMDALEKAIKAQTATLAAKLAAIETAVKEGFADEVKALGLIKDAIKAMDGTLKQKLDALKEAINDQTTALSTKLAAIEAAVTEGFLTEKEYLDYIRAAIASMDGTLQEKLDAINSAIADQTLQLKTKLQLIKEAIAAGFETEAEALAQIQTALNTLNGTAEQKLADIEAAIQAQTLDLKTKLQLIKVALEEGFTNAVTALNQVQAAVEGIEIPNYTDLFTQIKTILKNGFANQLTELQGINASLATIAAALPANLGDILSGIQTALNQISWNLSNAGPLAYQLAALNNAISGPDGTNAMLSALVTALGEDGIQGVLEEILDALAGSVDPETGDPIPGIADTLEEIAAALQAIAEALGGDVPPVEEPDSPENPTGEIDGESYVDMGDDLLIAVANVGADSPTELGDRFAWGEVETKPDNEFTLDNYRYWEAVVVEGGRAAAGRYTKYNADDELVTLTVSDDVAAQKMGENWRMMNTADLKALFDETKYEITYTEDYNGVAGAIITSLIEETKGNYIFLPDPENAGYYSAELGESEKVAYVIKFEDNNKLSVSQSNRELGNYVRGVVGTAPEDPEPPTPPTPQGPFTPENPSGVDEATGVAYVEMGDGLRWAIQNVGAASPTEKGNLYGFGDLTPKKDNLWKSYTLTSIPDGEQHADMSWVDEHGVSHAETGGNFIFKYTVKDNFKDGKWWDGNTFLGDNGDGEEHDSLADYDYKDDVARKTMGGSWRIPSYDEYKYLVNPDNFTFEKVTNYMESGMTGWKVISNIEGYEGNYIFLPSYASSEDDFEFYARAYWSNTVPAYDNNASHAKGSKQAFALYPDSGYSSQQEFTVIHLRKMALMVRGVMPDEPIDDPSGRIE